MARRGRKNLRYGVLAVVISTVLWGIAHGGSSIERGYDIPVAFADLPDDLVITDQTDTVVNVRVVGSRASLRNLSPTQMEYDLNVSGAKPGRTVHEVDVSRLDVPRGTRIVSRSPAQIEVRFERRGRKNVQVRAELVGEPAEGYALAGVEIEPPRVWLTGARSRVLRLTEVTTETIDLNGLDEPTERQVKLSLGNDRVWKEGDDPVVVKLAIEPVEPPEAEVEGEGETGGETG